MNFRKTRREQGSKQKSKRMENHRVYQGKAIWGVRGANTLYDRGVELSCEVAEDWLSPAFSAPQATQQDGRCPAVRIELSSEPLVQE